jgi:hypothetical protein
MKAILEFDLPVEREEFYTAASAPDMKAALYDIGQEVFRPARKHGYGGTIQRLLEKADTISTPSMDGYTEDIVEVGTELISQLEKLFYEILQRHGVEIL